MERDDGIISAEDRAEGAVYLNLPSGEVCFAPPGKDRPTEFASKADGGTMLMGLKKTSAVPPKPPVTP